MAEEAAEEEQFGEAQYLTSHKCYLQNIILLRQLFIEEEQRLSREAVEFALSALPESKRREHKRQLEEWRETRYILKERGK